MSEKELIEQSIVMLNNTIAEIDASDLSPSKKASEKAAIFREIAKAQRTLEKMEDKPTAAQVAQAWNTIREDVDAFIDSTNIHFVGGHNRWYIFNDGWHPLTLDAMQQMYPSKFTNKEWMGVFHARLDDLSRKKLDVTYSANHVPSTTLNLLTYDKIQPKNGEPHWFFDTLIASVCGNKTENIEHLEQLLVAKYNDPGNYLLPWVVFNDGGGTGKSLFAASILTNLFGSKAVNANMDIQDIVGKFNEQAVGLLVGFINEKPEDNYDHNKLKAFVGSEKFGVEPKGLRKYWAYNCMWGVMTSNNSVGTVKLANDDTDRRFSICSGTNPLKYYVSQVLNIGEDEAEEWVITEGQYIAKDKEKFAVWFNKILNKWGSIKNVKALRGEDYRALVKVQKTLDIEVFESIFNDDFSHIRTDLLNEFYIDTCKRLGSHAKGRNKFYIECDKWLKKNRPDIVRATCNFNKNKAKDFSKTNFYVVADKVNTTLDSNNDNEYYMEEYGRKNWRISL